MQTLRHLLLGALLGATFVWIIFASFHLGRRQAKVRPLVVFLPKKLAKVSKDFWRTSIYAALLGALIGLGIAAGDVFFPSRDVSPAYDSAAKVP
jgi:hypothetical protein